MNPVTCRWAERMSSSDGNGYPQPSADVRSNAATSSKVCTSTTSTSDTAGRISAVELDRSTARMSKTPRATAGIVASSSSTA